MPPFSLKENASHQQRCCRRALLFVETGSRRNGAQLLCLFLSPSGPDASIPAGFFMVLLPFFAVVSGTDRAFSACSDRRRHLNRRGPRHASSGRRHSVLEGGGGGGGGGSDGNDSGSDFHVRGREGPRVCSVHTEVHVVLSCRYIIKIIGVDSRHELSWHSELYAVYAAKGSGRICPCLAICSTYGSGPIRHLLFVACLLMSRRHNTNATKGLGLATKRASSSPPTGFTFDSSDSFWSF